MAGGLAFATTHSAVQSGNAVAACGKFAFLPSGVGISPPQHLPSGLLIQTLQAGHGAMPTANDFALVAYKGALTDGSVFDGQPKMAFPVSRVVPGFSEGLQHMQVGGVYRLCFPAALGYGAAGAGGGKIPPNATLLFAVQLLDFKSPEEIQQMKMQHPQNGQAQAGQPVGAPTSGTGAAN